MTQPPSSNQSEMDAYYERSRRPLIPNPETPLQKVGCGLITLVWFGVLLLPCAMFWLAMGNVIGVMRGGDIPDTENTPLFELRLISERDYAGLQFTSTDIDRLDGTNLCVETSVHYLLWRNDDDDNNNVNFCECYERENTESTWRYRGQDASDGCS